MHDQEKTSDTDFVTKAERGSGILIYRGFIGIAMVAIAGLGTWNLNETHGAAVMIRGLSEHMKDSDRELARIGSDMMQLRDRAVREIEDLKERDSKLETRVSVLENEIKKP